MSISPNAYGAPESVGSYASNIGYHENGSIETLTYGNGRVYTTSQDARQLPYDLKVTSGATSIAFLRHAYDANGNITAITDYVTASANRAMTYDDLDRLKTASGIWGSGSYTYDALGNLKTKTEGGQAMTYVYNTSVNRLTSITGANARTFSYDSFGNVTNNGIHGFTYNRAGNLVSSTIPSITYKYDGHKRRVQKTEGGQTSYTVYNKAGQLMHKLKGGVATDYIYAGSMLLAEKSGSTIDYMHTDLLGSPIKGTNGSNYTEHYTPWGEKWNSPVQLADDVGYTGHQSDVSTGLTYMQARYYDPVVGRFMANDPVSFSYRNPMSFGRYTYANNNTFKFIDPDGRDIMYFGDDEFRRAAQSAVANVLATGNKELIRRHEQLVKSPNMHTVRATEENESTGVRPIGSTFAPNPNASNGVGTGSIIRLDLDMTTSMDQGDAGIEGVITHELLGHSVSIDIGMEEEDKEKLHESGIPLDEAEAIDVENIYRGEIGLEDRPYDHWD